MKNTLPATNSLSLLRAFMRRIWSSSKNEKNIPEGSKPDMVFPADTPALPGKKPVKEKNAAEPALMTPATEKKIIVGLESFESSTIFLNNNISLSLLASMLSTNTKYLSYVIKHHRKTDFNNYINVLRINYVTNKLRTDEAWQENRISRLANEAGFSSHSKFATIFKNVTGVSPSTYIQQIKKD